MVHTCTVRSDGCQDWGCQPKPRDCCSERDLIAAVADRVGVAAGGKKIKKMISIQEKKVKK